jgi:hypothetical protein
MGGGLILSKIRGEKPDTHRPWAATVADRDPGSREGSPVHLIYATYQATADNNSGVDRAGTCQFAQSKVRSQADATADMCCPGSVRSYHDDFTGSCPRR